MHKLAACLALGSVALAQSDAAPKVAPVADGAFGIGITSQYFFRGILQENQGIIVQPWFELGYDLYEGAETLRELDLTLGLWNSLHDGPTGGAGGPWFESDFHVGLAAKVGDGWRVGTRYTAYHSPNGSFGTVEEIQFSVALDDRGMLVEGVESGLRPSLLVAIEVDGQRDAGNHVGNYAQLGIEPTFPLGPMGSLDVTLSVPVKAGFSLGDYYEDLNGGDDDFFGFLDVGVAASSPLPFLPARMGPWSGVLALHWLLLGDNNEQRNVGDTSELILSFAVETVF